MKAAELTSQVTAGHSSL